jgi:hypothetical protein
MIMLAPKVTGSQRIKMTAFKRVLQVVLSARVTSKTIVKKVWVWAWVIDRAVVTTWRMKVEVLMLFLKVVVQDMCFKKLNTTATSKEPIQIN